MGLSDGSMDQSILITWFKSIVWVGCSWLFIYLLYLLAVLLFLFLFVPVPGGGFGGISCGRS